jgi:hypothetical protein
MMMHIDRHTAAGEEPRRTSDLKLSGRMDAAFIESPQSTSISPP